ncbi:MAG: cytochrome c-type biogenesis CcmF C-terminal domain-containing protein, partial [bacterium]
TRGSILDSVHAFAQSIVGPLYLGFLALILLAGFGLIASRSHLLRTESLIDAPFSREAAFLGNNLGLVVITFTVLLGTIYPLLAEALSGRRVSVGAPYFNQTATPAMLLLLFLMAVGPLVPWKAGSPRRLLRRVQVPVWGASATVAALAVAGVRNLAALAAFGLASFVALATLSELFKSAVHYRNTFGGNLASATIGAARRNRRLFGGLFVHLGLVLAAVAITASSSFDRRTEMTLARGEVRTFARYDFRFEGVREMHQPHRRSVVADVSLLDRGVRVMKLTPLMNFYPNARDPIGTPSIRTGSLTNGFRDIYISLSSVAGDGASASFRVYEIPGVLWLWIGGGVMAAGGVFAAWPSRRTRKPVGSRELRRQRQLEGVAP